MDHIAALEQKMVSERIKQKLNQVNAAAQAQLAPVQDHINFSLQQAYFKCAYECFDRRRNQQEISRCAENCSAPVVNAQHHFENEMAKFQEKLNRSLMVCNDNFETAKLQQKPNGMKDLESCVNQTIEDSINTLPHLAERMKAALSVNDKPNEC